MSNNGTCVQCHYAIGDDDYRDATDIDSSLPRGPIHNYCAMYVLSEREAMRTAAKALVSPLIDYVNRNGSKALAAMMLHTLTYSHRTLQQSFLGAIRLLLHDYAALDPGMNTDGRNECAHAWAREVSKLPNSDLRFPLI